MSDQVDIGLLRELLERGTKGAWEFWPRGEIVASETSETVASGDIDIHGEEVYIRIRTADGELIVAAVNALPALLDEIERLREYQATNLAIKKGMLERLKAAQTVTRPPTDASLTATDMLILRVAPSPGDATATEAASYTLSIADMSVEQRVMRGLMCGHCDGTLTLPSGGEYCENCGLGCCGACWPDHSARCEAEQAPGGER